MDGAVTSSHHFVFIGGVHRSGTSLLHRCLREHPLFDGFQDTGVPEDEGQHLQNVFPADTIVSPYRLNGWVREVARFATFFGGSGKYAFRRSGHLTESSRWCTEARADELFEQWARYWDVSKPYLMEKSPSNITRMRFFQTLFPESSFLVIVRHPIPVAFSTQSFRRTPQTLHSIIKHWILCHRLLRADLRFVRRIKILCYEDFTRYPQETLDEIYSFLGVPSHPNRIGIKTNLDLRHFRSWMDLHKRPWTQRYMRFLTNKYEEDVNCFGYSLLDLDLANPVEAIDAP